MPARFNPRGARTTFALPDDVREKIARLIDATGRSAVEVVADAVRDRYASLMAPVACGRCGRSVPRVAAERCHSHGCRLCYDCWDEHGACGREMPAPPVVGMEDASRA